MQYKPGSKYKVSQASEGVFLLKIQQTPYEGSYLEMSDGTFFVGDDINNLGLELIKKEELKRKKGKTISATKFNILRESYFEFISRTKDIIATKNFPTKKEYIIGFFTRYFVKRKNEPLGYKEIDKKTYDSLKNKKTEYDWHLYDCGKLLWVLNGGANTANTKSIKITERKFKGIGMIFPNVEEFYLPPSIKSPKSQKIAADEAKEKPTLNTQTENNPLRKKHAPPSDKEVKTPALRDIQEGMLRDIQEKHRKKQDQINQEKKELRIPTRIEKLREGTPSSGGGMSSGGGTSGGGGGGY